MTSWLRRHGTSDATVKETSNRELIMIIPDSSSVDAELAGKGKKVFEIRNKLAHGLKTDLSRPEVKEALGVVTKLSQALLLATT